MKTAQLVAVGLTQMQAEAYSYLLKSGSVSPPTMANDLKLSRTNAYKVLDRLTELELAKREERDKKYMYLPDNPLALTNLVAEQRNIATAREEAVKQVMNDLLASYHQHTEQPSVHVVTGRDAVAEAYKAQIRLQQPIHFIRSRADIPSMGFDLLHEIRVMPARHGQKRHGITPDMTTGPVNPEGDKRSKLERTWIRKEDYDAPVEWSVSGSSLLIVLFGAEPHAITISSPLIALAFHQIWSILSVSLQQASYYRTLPRTRPSS